MRSMRPFISKFGPWLQFKPISVIMGKPKTLNSITTHFSTWASSPRGGFYSRRDERRGGRWGGRSWGSLGLWHGRRRWRRRGRWDGGGGGPLIIWEGGANGRPPILRWGNLEVGLRYSSRLRNELRRHGRRWAMGNRGGTCPGYPSVCPGGRVTGAAG